MDLIREALARIVAEYKRITADGAISFSDVLAIFTAVVSEVVVLAEHLPANGAAKKRVVLEALGEFIDQVITPIDLPFIPDIIEPVVDRSIKTFLLGVADKAIDGVVSGFNRTGWPTAFMPPVADHFSDE